MLEPRYLLHPRLKPITAYLDNGDVPRAEALFRAAANLAPEDRELWVQVAEFSTLNEFNIAAMGIPAARNAFTTGRMDPRGASLLGYAHALAGDMVIAERLLHLAVSLNPYHPMVQYHLGVLRLIQGDLDGAKAAFLQAHELSPTGTYGRLAEIQLRE